MKFSVLGITIAFVLLSGGSFLRAEEDDDLIDFPFDGDSSESLGAFELNRETANKPVVSLDDFGDEFNDDVAVESDNGDGQKKASFVKNKEKLIRTALSKALTNRSLRQKFVEVVPILRVLSKPQRLAFASLITTQINAKPGQELKLKQVESMFGDSRKLILPIVFDMANLVKHAAKSVLDQQQFKKYPIDQIAEADTDVIRRNYEVLPGDDGDIVDYEYVDEVMDAKDINEELYAVVSNSSDISPKRRSKRSAPLSFLERLSFLMPRGNQRRSVNGAYQIEDRRLNTTNVNVQDQQALSTEGSQIIADDSVDSSSLAYEQIEDLAFNELNGTEIPLNQTDTDNESHFEELPKPESLIRSRPRVVSNKLGHGHRKPPQYRHPIRSRKTPNPLGHCERFTSSMCIRTEDYPMEQIMGSIRRHRNAMSALLAEFRDKSAELEQQEILDDLLLNKKRREDDNGTPGGMCSSVVRYARPQKARSATGEWKYIVNTGQHSQTLRLEKCSNPQESCSYLTENYRSRCVQIYNYHRLLSWDKTRGLHVDIFKVPTCCSCHVDGYRDLYPPIASSNIGNKLKDYSHFSKLNPYSTISDDEDYDDEEEVSESIAYQFGNGFKKVKSNKYDPLHSGSSIKSSLDFAKGPTKIGTHTANLGTYLSPPYDEFDSNYPFKRGPELSSQNVGLVGGLSSVPRRALSHGYHHDVGDRLDQDIGGSEGGKEVTVYPPIDTSTVRPSRKRISSVSTAQQTPTSRETRLSGLSPATATNDSPYRPDQVFDTKFSGTTSKTDMSKRINYNYHPIIDFFEEQAQHLSSSSQLALSTTTGLPKIFTGYRTSNEIPNVVQPVDSNWRPVVVE